VNIRPKKSLGQNFLNSKAVIKQIINSANLTVDDLVLEIGPGKGMLTEELAGKCKKVIAIEIDKDLVSLLRDKFKENKNVEIVNEDILKTELLSIFKTYNLQPTTYKLIANIPYYITSPIIRFFLENKFPPQEMILMVQKEVAERITAKPGNHSILSLSVQYYANPELLFYVDKSNFNPIPEVDSAVIKVSSIKYNVSSIERDNFFRVVRAGFCAKRKTLINNLANSFHLDKKEVEEKLKAVGLSPTARAQELDIEDWKKLSKYFI
jgi:16S rRNA (adenine1518-N6/adenine1519-N6)-dimethyltransferase